MANPTPLLSRRRQLGAAVESTKGTAETIDATEAKFLIINPTITPEYENFTREYLQSSLSPRGVITTRKMVRLEFSIEARATNNVAATADAWGVLLRGCGFAESVDSLTTKYLPASSLSAQETLTLKLFMDGFAVTIKGACGNVEMSASVGQPMLWNFSFFGILSEANDAALLTITQESGVPAPFQNLGMTVNTKTPCIESLSINMNNEVEPVICANETEGVEYVAITGRNTELTMNPGLNTDADSDGLDYWDLYAADTTLDIAFNLGTTNPKLGFAIPKAQITGISDDDRNGIDVAGLTCVCVQNTDAGDNEFSLTKVCDA
jgi:hypothetical protein